MNTTRTYQYDTLGNLIREEQDGCVEYKYNGAHLDESTKCGTIPNSIGTSYWEYTYDNRGNLVSRDKYTRTTSGMAWQNEAAYTYDETNRLVQGKNEDGEISLYTYNGLGMRVGRELIMKDNTHGYTDFHDLTPSVDTGIDKPEVVLESYVIDYTSATFDPLTMDEDGGFSYRYVYGLNTLSVKITSEGTNWWGQHVTTDILKDYYHQDRLGSTTNLTDKFGRVVGRADYNEWGEITYREALTITSSYRRIYPQSSYTGHDWDDVLGMYYAKARFYSAEDKRFVSMDPIKGEIVNPLSLVPYVYCVNNPLRWVDILGLVSGDLFINGIKVEYIYQNGEAYASMKDLMRAMHGQFYSATTELQSRRLPNGDREFWEVDTSPIYYAQVQNMEWTVDKTKLQPNKVTSISTWKVSGTFRGDKIAMNTGKTLDFISFQPKGINEEVIGVDINQFINWYYKQFDCLPTIQFEIGDGGVWERDYKPTIFQYLIYVLNGGTDPYEMFSPTGVESVAIIPKEDFRDYYINNMGSGKNQGLEWLIEDSTGEGPKVDLIFNAINRFYDEWTIHNYSKNDNIKYISATKQIGIETHYDEDDLSYKSHYYTQYILQPVVYKEDSDKLLYTVDPIRNDMRIGKWEPRTNK